MFKMDEIINTVSCGLCLDMMKQLPEQSIDCVITSPPYYCMRDYGFDEQWGLEFTFDLYLEHLWQFMNEVWRILKDTGTVWINLGDCYNSNSSYSENKKCNISKLKNVFDKKKYGGISYIQQGRCIGQKIPNKCLLLIPSRFALGCINPDYELRDDLSEEERRYVLSELLK